MMPESMENVNQEITQEDHGYYYGRGTETGQNPMVMVKPGGNFVQNYQPRDEQLFQGIPESQRDASSARGE